MASAPILHAFFLIMVITVFSSQTKVEPESNTESSPISFVGTLGFEFPVYTSNEQLDGFEGIAPECGVYWTNGPVQPASVTSTSKAGG